MTPYSLILYFYRGHFIACFANPGHNFIYGNGILVKSHNQLIVFGIGFKGNNSVRLLQVGDHTGLAGDSEHGGDGEYGRSHTPIRLSHHNRIARQQQFPDVLL